MVFGPVKFRQSGPKVGPRLKLELEPDVFTFLLELEEEQVPDSGRVC